MSFIRLSWVKVAPITGVSAVYLRRTLRKVQCDSLVEMNESSVNALAGENIGRCESVSVAIYRALTILWASLMTCLSLQQIGDDDADVQPLTLSDTHCSRHYAAPSSCSAAHSSALSLKGKGKQMPTTRRSHTVKNSVSA